MRDTIDDFLPETMRGNFALFEKYPDYVFSFEGAFHYALMKEYYPAEWERLKGYVKAGRWKVAGSWVDAVDTHVPSPESLVRQALYGNGFFRRGARRHLARRLPARLLRLLASRSRPSRPTAASPPSRRRS